MWSDLHKGAGVWGLLFTLVIALTGLFYFVEIGFIAAGNHAALTEALLPGVADSSLEGRGPQPDLLPAGAYVEAARDTFPGLDVHSVRMPQQPGEAVYVDGQAGNPLTRDRANEVHLHPFAGEVLGVQRSSALGVVPFITDLADPLHFGYFGRRWTKVLWFVLELMLSFSVLSGTYLWVVRSGPARASPGEALAPGALRPFTWLRGAVVATALTLAYFGIAAWTTVEGIQEYAPPAQAPQEVAQVEAGPYRVQIACAAPCRPADGATLTARFRESGLPTYRAATLGPPGAARGTTPVARGRARRQRAHGHV